jgi:hypothetical protein
VNNGRSLPLNRGQNDIEEIIDVGDRRDRLETVNRHLASTFLEVEKGNKGNRDEDYVDRVSGMTLFQAMKEDEG